MGSGCSKSNTAVASATVGLVSSHDTTHAPASAASVAVAAREDAAQVPTAANTISTLPEGAGAGAGAAAGATQTGVATTTGPDACTPTTAVTSTFKAAAPAAEATHVSQVLLSRATRVLNAERQRRDGAEKKSVLHGDAEVAAHAETDKRMVRLFTSSTFTDTKDWRDALMRDVFPVLKTMCQRLDLEFQVVDMRWGVRESTGNDHGTSGLCMWELEQCKRLSMGPAFVTFLGDRYGYRPFPAAIPEAELDALKAVMERDTVSDNTAALALIEQWFLLDSNRVPAEYILQPVSTFYPAFVDTKDREAQHAASAQWWPVFDAMQTALRTAAGKCTDSAALPPERAQLYTISVTNEEVMRGLLSNDARNSQCFVYDRTFVNVDWQARNVKTGGPDDAALKKFADWDSGTGTFDAEAHARQVALKTHGIAESGFDTANRLVRYEVPIADVAGPNVDIFKKDFLERIGGSILDAFAASRMEPDAVFDEAHAQLVAARQKGVGYIGRPDLRQSCADFALWAATPAASASTEGSDADAGAAPVPSGRRLVVVHGKSGCGKTTLLSRCALDVIAQTHTRQGGNGRGVVIVRLLGTTPLSSRSRDVMVSVLSQMRAVYNGSAGADADANTDTNSDERQVKSADEVDTMDIGVLETYFKDAVTTLPSGDKPLWLFLDSFDQLSDDDDGRKVTWVPRAWQNPHVCIIVSTLPAVGPTWSMLGPTTTTTTHARCHYIEVAPLGEGDVDLILQDWQGPAGRKFPPAQLAILSNACKAALSPLYLRLAFDTAASQWHSYSRAQDMALEPTLQALIHALFARLETRHGEVLVRHALGYVSCAAGAGGVTSAELEDVLSCDDQVLQDVYQWWTPPVRRIPPLIWSRVRAELGSYLADRGAGGALTHGWYHRQFTEVAERRFLYRQSGTDGASASAGANADAASLAADDAALHRALYRHGTQWPERHAMLARYFGGELDKGVVYQGVVEDRQVVGMPLSFDDGADAGADVHSGNAGSVHSGTTRRTPTTTTMPLRVNSRRLAHQVYHQIRAGMVVELDDSTLGNFEYLHARGIVSDGGLAALRRECGDAKAMLTELHRLERSQPSLRALLRHDSAKCDAVAAFVRYINENLHLAHDTSFDFACNALTWAADESVVYQRAHQYLSRHVAIYNDNTHTSSNNSTGDRLSRTLVALPGWKKSMQLRPELTLPKAKGEIQSVAVSASQQLLAVCARHDASVSLVDIHTGATNATIATVSGADASCAAFEGSTVLAVAENKVITIWDLDNSTSVGTFRARLEGHTRGCVEALSFQCRDRLPRDGPPPRLASGGLDQSVIIWDVEAQLGLFKVTNVSFVYSLQFHPLTPSLLLYGNSGVGDVRILDIVEKQNVASIDTTATEGRGCDTWSVAWNHDGTMVAEGRDHGLFVFDVVPEAGPAGTAAAAYRLLTRIKLNEDGAKAVAFGPTGRYLCAGAMTFMSVLIYDVLSGECVGNLVGHSNRVACVAVRAVTGQDGASHSQFITGGDDALVQFWNVPKIEAAVATGSMNDADADKVSWHERGVGRLVYNSETGTIASCSTDGSVKLWSQEWQLLASIRHDGHISACALGPAGLVACATDLAVRLWRAVPPPAPSTGSRAQAGNIGGGLSRRGHYDVSLLRIFCNPPAPAPPAGARGFGGGMRAANRAWALAFSSPSKTSSSDSGHGTMLAIAMPDGIRIFWADDTMSSEPFATITATVCSQMQFVADGSLVAMSGNEMSAQKLFLIDAARITASGATASKPTAAGSDETPEVGSEAAQKGPQHVTPTCERAVGKGLVVDLCRSTGAIAVRQQYSRDGEQPVEVFMDVVEWISAEATLATSEGEGSEAADDTITQGGGILLAHTGSPVASVHFHPGGGFVATYSEEKDISVFKLADGSLLTKVASLPGADSGALWTPSAFATLCSSGVKLWANDKLLSPDAAAALPRPMGLKSAVQAIVFSASGRKLATVERDQVKIWEMGHGAGSDSMKAPPPTPRELFSFKLRGGGADHGTIGQLFSFHSGEGDDGVGDDGCSENLFMAGTMHSDLQVWDISRECLVAKLKASRGQGAEVFRAAFLSSTTIVLAVGGALKCNMWDLPTATDSPRKVDATPSTEVRAVPWIGAASSGLSEASLGQMRGLGLHPRGLFVSLGMADGAVHVFIPATGAHACTLKVQPPTSMLDMCFNDSSNTVFFAAAGGGGEVCVWRLFSEKEIGNGTTTAETASNTVTEVATTFTVECSTRGHESGVVMMVFAGTQLACSYFAEMRAIGVAVIDLSPSLSNTGQDQGQEGHYRLGVFAQEGRIPMCIALAAPGLVVCGMRDEAKITILDFTAEDHGAAPVERSTPWIETYPGGDFDQALEDTMGVRIVTRDAVAVAESRSNGRRHTKDIRGVCWLPPSSTRPMATVATGSIDTTIKLWDALSGQLQATLRGKKADTTTYNAKDNEVLHLTMHEDGNSLAASSADGTVRVWDIERRLEVRMLKNHTANTDIFCSAFGRGDLSHILVTVGDTIEVCDWRAGTHIATLNRKLDEPDHFMAKIAKVMFVVWAPPLGGAHVLATAHLDGSIVVWDVQLKAADGVAGGAGGAGGGVDAVERGVLRGPPRGLHCLSFNHNGQRLASAFADGGVRLWDPAQTDRPGISNVGTQGPLYAKYDTMPGLVREFKDAHKGHVSFCMFNPRADQGHILVSGGQDNAVCLFDTNTLTKIAVLQGHTNAVYNTTFSPDGDMLATSSQDESAIVWAPVPIALSLAP